MNMSRILHLICFASLLNVSASAANNCLEFDGQRSYVEIPIALGEVITVSVWAKGIPHTKMLWVIDNDCKGPGLMFYNGTISLNTWDSDANWMAQWPQDMNSWHQFTTVVEPSGAILYIDGRVAGKGKYRNPAGFLVFISGGPTWSCPTGNMGEYHWQGQVDEFRVWNRALTQDEIVETMNAELSGAEPGLILYFNFNEEAQVGRLVDQSIAKRTGSMVGNVRLVPSSAPVALSVPPKLIMELNTDESDGDGIFEAAETCAVTALLRNIGPEPAKKVSISFSAMINPGKAVLVTGDQHFIELLRSGDSVTVTCDAVAAEDLSEGEVTFSASVSARSMAKPLTSEVTLQTRSRFTKPRHPALLMIGGVALVEPSANGALDGYESGEIVVEVGNRGQGEAQNVQLNLSPLVAIDGLSFEKAHVVGRIDANQIDTIRIPISASGDLQTLVRKIRLQISEEFGFDAEPVVLTFETVAFQPPDLQINKIGIDDGTDGDAFGNGNSIVELNESIVVTAFVQNIGAGKAEHVQAEILLESNDPNLSCPDTGKVYSLGDIQSGDYKPVQFYFFSSKRFVAEDVPIRMRLTESKGDFGKTVDLGLKMNKLTDNIVDVTIARIEQLKPVVKEIAGAAKSDIDDAPGKSITARPNGFAVVIGIEDYKYAPNATYASRDAEAFYNYAVQVLGVPDANTYYSVNDGATVGEFMKLFDEGGWLSRRVTPESEVFVFYSGHGAPDIATKNPYLIPYDVDPNYANKGYSALALYENLGKLGTKSVTVMLDACFSGQDREDKMLLADARPVRISAGVAGVPENVTVLSASSGDEISSSYPEQRHGIFSYYLMKGLGGSADGDANRQITMQELYDYVSAAVKRTAGQMDRLQTPALANGVPADVLVGY